MNAGAIVALLVALVSATPVPTDAPTAEWEVCPDHGQCGGSPMSDIYTQPLDVMQSLCMQDPYCDSVECDTSVSPVLCKGYNRSPTEPICDEPETPDLRCYAAPYHERTVTIVESNASTDPDV
jgi:hypothetical protein